LVRLIGFLVLAFTLFLGFEGTEPAAARDHASGATWTVEEHPTKWIVDACDDDDQDDSAPSSQGSAPGSDEDVLFSGHRVTLRPGVVSLSFCPESAGLKPARGHDRIPEHPPESRLIRLES
jgi:hypothetical protein